MKGGMNMIFARSELIEYEFKMSRKPETTSAEAV